MWVVDGEGGEEMGKGEEVVKQRGREGVGRRRGGERRGKEGR